MKAESAAAVSDEDDAISMRMDLADSSSSDSDNHFGTRTGRRERVGRKDRIKVPQAEGMPPAPSKTQIPIAEHGDASSDDIPSDPRLTAQGEDLVKTIAGGQEDDMTDAQEEKKVLTQMLQSPEDEDHESYGQQTGMDSVVKFSTINVSTRSGSYNRSGRGMPYSSADCANTIKAPSIRPSDITEKEIKAHQPNNNKGLSSKSLKRQRYREREQARRAEEEEEAAMDVDPAAIDGTTSLRSPSTIPTDALPPPPTRMPIPDPTQEPPPPSAKDFKLVDGQLIPMAEWRRAKKARDRAKKRERKRFFKSQGMFSFFFFFWWSPWTFLRYSHWGPSLLEGVFFWIGGADFGGLGKKREGYDGGGNAGGVAGEGEGARGGAGGDADRGREEEGFGGGGGVPRGERGGREGGSEEEE